MGIIPRSNIAAIAGQTTIQARRIGYHSEGGDPLYTYFLLPPRASPHHSCKSCSFCGVRRQIGPDPKLNVQEQVKVMSSSIERVGPFPRRSRSEMRCVFSHRLWSLSGRFDTASRKKSRGRRVTLEALCHVRFLTCRRL
jgi:hypothetical protein